MHKIKLIVLVAVSFTILASFSMTAFAEPVIVLGSFKTEIGPLDTILVGGEISGINTYKPVKLTVTSPSGEIIYAPLLPVAQDGTFKWLIKPVLPSFENGVYTVTASHDDVVNDAQIQFTVIGSTPIQKVPVTALPDSNTVNKTPSAITLSTKFDNGGNKITLIGSTTSSVTDITYKITSPNGNLISIGQITPDTNGEFSTEIIIGGSLWKENGLYTITANQGLSSEHKQSIQVEIDNGVVVPEFGSIAVMILAIAIVSIIAVSSKSRLAIPRY
ncbi:MAG TPA: PEFG-CTERM sorting domain-containing protein [Nitrosarchaeum sp.]|nr:PEFG-CTERM sorting domain-containing protein [Nitrosarchaeum sp.]